MSSLASAYIPESSIFAPFSFLSVFETFGDRLMKDNLPDSAREIEYLIIKLCSRCRPILFFPIFIIDDNDLE